MNFNYIYRLLLTLTILLCTSCYQTALSERGETVYKIGDKKEWSNPEFNDVNWGKDFYA